MFEDKESMAREIVEMLGYEEKFKNFIKDISDPYIAYGTADIVKEIGESMMETGLKRTIEVYKNTFSRGTLKGLLKFYKSKVGTEYVRSLGAMESNMVAMLSDLKAEVLQVANQELLKRRAQEGINWRDYIPPIKL